MCISDEIRMSDFNKYTRSFFLTVSHAYMYMVPRGRLSEIIPEITGCAQEANGMAETM